jgi:hypothetical protein
MRTVSCKHGRHLVIPEDGRLVKRVAEFVPAPLRSREDGTDVPSLERALEPTRRSWHHQIAER